MLVAGFAAGPLRSNCYLLARVSGGPCLVVDPGEGAAEPLAAALAEHELTPAALLATHGHPDHVGGAAEATRRYGVPLRLHPADAEGYAGPWEPLAEGPLTVAGLTVGVLPLPGHTPGSVAFTVETGEGGRLVLTGDTLFAGSIGRARGSGADLERSLRTLLTLAGDTVVLPGHGPATTIERERAGNPHLPGAVR
ncbi:MBL fold metallo-hydrolase [Amycolatopsis jiangsuensis]|uniref:Glyoxylase-like metal-dependent hydrolase (Beta-lactamase superfamily II) n=1 Tax=Amycolatopsis jiangsuensis TaxID=1181879 RepID=A0A840IMN7_9PSEU|nr:MBL fold metallo-hydrolase [Amycolatopsis jiangsuensis]MBB4683210.1 glyoxylase-like metal-dependent hydrolase (beta-lactamase superfamily II) [Amycolatopsis jiangsuensis]